MQIYFVLYSICIIFANGYADEASKMLSWQDTLPWG